MALTLTAGDQVRFTASRMGVLEDDDDLTFAAPTISAGAVGTYVGRHPSMPDWHLARVVIEGRTYLCPFGEPHVESVG